MNHSEQREQPGLFPDYYPKFSCLADTCPDTCCKGWGVEVDPAAWDLWKQVSEEIRRKKAAGRNENMLIPEDHLMKPDRNRVAGGAQIRMNSKMVCPFLDKKGLCSLVVSHGERILPDICRVFPRHVTELEIVTQKTLSLRCSAVLDLLWEKENFAYSTEPENVGTEFPSKALLDFFLAEGNRKTIPSERFLLKVFTTLVGMHRKLEAENVPEESGIREFGTELFLKEHVTETMERFRSETDPVLPFGYKIPLGEYHELLAAVVLDYLDNPVFGFGFASSLKASEQLFFSGKTDLLNEEQKKRFRDLDRRLYSVILEELFSSVFSPEVQEYETALLRLQWLILQITVIRYLLVIDCSLGRDLTDDLLKNRISQIFRVTDQPDIRKLLFFDEAFLNWLWPPEKAAALLMFL